MKSLRLERISKALNFLGKHPQQLHCWMNF